MLGVFRDKPGRALGDRGVLRCFTGLMGPGWLGAGFGGIAVSGIWFVTIALPCIPGT